MTLAESVSFDSRAVLRGAMTATNTKNSVTRASRQNHGLNQMDRERDLFPLQFDPDGITRRTMTGAYRGIFIGAAPSATKTSL